MHDLNQWRAPKLVALASGFEAQGTDNKHENCKNKVDVEKITPGACDPWTDLPDQPDGAS
jgi:hypothetical protein